jgi:hypothetical protein
MKDKQYKEDYTLIVSFFIIITMLIIEIRKLEWNKNALID